MKSMGRHKVRLVDQKERERERADFEGKVEKEVDVNEEESAPMNKKQWEGIKKKCTYIDTGSQP